VSDVFWSESALDDMDALAAYIAADNPAAALRVIDRIEAAAELLGHAAIGRKGRVAEAFEKPVKDLPYIIAYALEPMPDGDARIVISPGDPRRQGLAGGAMAEMTAIGLRAQVEH
jgi:toxin ParE1/3/4